MLAVVIIVEEMNVVQYQNEWFACSSRIAQRNLLQFVECCRVDEGKRQYSLQDRENSPRSMSNVGPAAIACIKSTCGQRAKRRTFSRIPSLEQTGLGILVELVIQGLAEA